MVQHVVLATGPTGSPRKSSMHFSAPWLWTQQLQQAFDKVTSTCLACSIVTKLSSGLIPVTLLPISSIYHAAACVKPCRRQQGPSWLRETSCKRSRARKASTLAPEQAANLVRLEGAGWTRGAALGDTPSGPTGLQARQSILLLGDKLLLAMGLHWQRAALAAGLMTHSSVQQVQTQVLHQALQPGHHRQLGLERLSAQSPGQPMERSSLQAQLVTGAQAGLT